jgi:hypothetical protein
MDSEIEHSSQALNALGKKMVDFTISYLISPVDLDMGQ